MSCVSTLMRCLFLYLCRPDLDMDRLLSLLLDFCLNGKFMASISSWVGSSLSCPLDWLDCWCGFLGLRFGLEESRDLVVAAAAPPVVLPPAGDRLALPGEPFMPGLPPPSMKSSFPLAFLPNIPFTKDMASPWVHSLLSSQITDLG